MATAQDARTREVGLRLSGLEDFDLLYKKSITEDTYRRYRFFNGNFSFLNVEGSSVADFSVGASVGKEKRSPLAGPLQFVRGPEFFASLSLQATDDDFQFILSPGVGYVLGLQYDLSERFYIGLETIPSLSISYGNGISRIVTLNAGFATSAVALTAMYRFYK